MSDLTGIVSQLNEEMRSQNSQRKHTVVRTCSEEHLGFTPPANATNPQPQSAAVYFCLDPEMAYLAQFRFKLIIDDPLGPPVFDTTPSGNESSVFGDATAPNYGVIQNPRSHGGWPSVRDFFNYANGHGVDMDGAFGFQCYDFADFFYVNQVGVEFWTGNNAGGGEGQMGVLYSWLNEAARNHNTVGGTMQAIPGNSDIQVGDICIFNTGDNIGHVAMALDSSESFIFKDQGRIHICGQNQGGFCPYPGAGAYANVTTMSVNGLIGKFRYTDPDFDKTAPSGYDIRLQLA